MKKIFLLLTSVFFSTMMFSQVLLWKDGEVIYSKNIDEVDKISFYEVEDFELVNDVIEMEYYGDWNESHKWIHAEFTPKKSYAILEYESSDESVATVSYDGYVVARGVGETTITVTIYGTKISKTCKVKVLAPRIKSVNPTELEIRVGESSRISVSVDGGRMCEFEWKSADEKVATVSDGVVTGVAIGETTVEVNIQGSDDVKTVKVSVVGELDAVKYQGIYLMLNANAPLYELQNQETGAKIPVRPIDIMFVPDNFYVSAGQWAGSWDYPLLATTTVEDRRHLKDSGEDPDRDGYVMVFGYYNFAPVSESIVTDVDGFTILKPYTFGTDDFNKENYEKFFYEALITYNSQEIPDAVYEQYAYQTEFGSYLYKWSWDDQVQFICGYPTGKGVMYSPGFPNEEAYFADIAYDFNVKFFTNPDYYGLDLIPGEDPETGEPVMNYPVDENDMPIIRMAEITDYHFVGGTVDFPEEVSYAPCKRVGLSSAAVEKISAVNHMILKSVTYNKDLAKLFR